MQKKLKSAAFPLLSIIIGLSFSSLASIAQEAEPTDFNPGDFSGDWDRVTSIVTYSNVPGSSRAPNNRPMEDVGPVAEAPFTAEGLALIEANDPGYGPRRQMVRNDPLGRCEPMGIPRNLTAEVLVPITRWKLCSCRTELYNFLNTDMIGERFGWTGANFQIWIYTTLNGMAIQSVIWMVTH